MKLLTRIGRSYMFAAGIAFLSGLAILYAILLWLVRMETDEKLVNSSVEIARQIEIGRSPPAFPPFIEIRKTQELTNNMEIRDTLIFDPAENENEPYRELTTVKRIGGQFYRITVRSSEIENTEFITSAFIILALVFTFFMIGLFFLNRRQTVNILNPFFRNLEAVKSFSLTRLRPVRMEHTGTDEFDEMKEVLEQLMHRASEDYQNLKQFTENASHELQTPLAVIRSKLEALINDEDLSEGENARIEELGRSVSRLERMNKSLLLLTRIDNRQFSDRTKVNLTRLVKEQIDQLSELMLLKGLHIHWEKDDEFEQQINPELAGIVVSNLLSNALNHTPEGGEISLFAAVHELRIANTGNGELSKKSYLFHRFVKEDPSGSGSGLGLAIVKTICDTNGLEISYQWEEAEKKHIFRISSKK